MRNLFTFILFIYLPGLAFAQGGREVSGILRDSTGNSVIAATIKLTSPKDTLFTRSDIDGKFRFPKVQSSEFVLSISSLGFRTFNQRFLYKEGSTPLSLPAITLRMQSNVLNEVTVSGAMPITVKEDTVEYRASDYPVRENSVVEDVIRKLPGVEVDKDGNVTTQGKSVTRVRVNGKDFFDGDLKTATQNLPADIIEKIQVIDDYGDQANISGIRDGEPDKILNITISPDRNKGTIVNMVAGGGSEERYQVSGMGQFMNNDQQLSVLLNLNNTNASMFDFVGGGNQRGGRFRGGGGGGMRGGGGGGAGITNTKAGGFNYRDELSDKVSVFGSYSVQLRDTDTDLQSLTKTVSGGGRDVETELTRNSNDQNDSHRFNFNVEYRIDSLNYLKVSPSFNYSGNESFSTSNSIITEQFRQDQATIASANSRSPSYGADVLYNHRFLKPGRNFSLNFSFNNSSTKNDQDAEDEFLFFYDPEDLGLATDSSSHRLIYTRNERFNTEANAVYSEPIGRYARLDFSYNFNRSSYDNSRITHLEGAGGYVPVDSLSNVFDYSFTTNRFGLAYRFDKDRLYNFTVGVSAQPSLLEGYSETNNVSARRSAFNFFPNARFSYNFAKSRSLNVNYSGRSSEPSYNQIQPVVDLSNPQRPIVGNPNLKSAFNQTLNVRYNNFDPAAGTFFNVGIAGNITNNRITSNIVRLRQPVTDSTYNLIQETRYLNTNGYYAANAFYSWSKPFAERKYTLRLNGSANFTNDVSYTDNLKNIGKTWSLSQGLRMQVNPNENIDVAPGVSYRHSWVDYSLPTSFDTKNSTWSIDLSGRIYFMKSMLLGFDGSKNINRGYSTAVENPLIVNAYLEKQFFNRRGRLRLQGYDLFNEGVNVSATQGDNAYIESSTNRLTRYFMLSFAYRLNRFAGASRPEGDFRRGGEGRPRGEMRPRF